MGRAINYLNNTQNSFHQNSFTTHTVVPSLSCPCIVSSYITLTMHTAFIYYHTEHGLFIAQKAYIHGATHDSCTVKGTNKREARYYITTVVLRSLTPAFVKFQPLMQWHTHAHTHNIWKLETYSSQLWNGSGDCSCFKVETAPHINQCAMPPHRTIYIKLDTEEWGTP